ncbi:MAG: Extracellular ligand-binding receptor [Candidatus Wolfebacteria bacterium GW2011_GWC2_46_275]|uniref:Extracellular ligand-binding receptor n=2 Tax=Candidatus Wolfeibacteriota TaxID=1752735 RepID=A0A0G1U8T2_9BACT|nr:MAG: extracellular ligand-binding receptor [Candidatus Wolfebacteria bacterium GW2011_GWB1_47_1]KKU37195.1 MAG: Extracellular ligand-binding receptor [Candidatus Wolfebacteria bacterium GW2011_GWC2_46_275]KKU42645.1 MAG: Extracellular ligand-binding receptor [Candidatus Wolfebacteria bacterium GW2011_GWB2_46_69]KKU54620.1 MAG: Extracellular ligand-binding receptor [Candidatus Wolfebacteria bacterium GW2011_GWC1_47_103]KKU60004.1 MAG: Extracellular ligand-binding receptor [Candidatus Wolfebac
MTKRTILSALSIIAVIATGSYFLFRNTNKPQTEETVANTTGVTRDTIRIGTVKALTGPTAFLGTEYAIGEQTYINALNDAGGIYGRKIRLISYDDQYDPPKTAYYTQKLIVDDGVFALLNYVGTPTGKVALPMINEAQIPLVGLFSGAKIFREPLQPYIFNTRVSYHEEGAAVVNHLVKTSGLTKIAVLYQYDDFGFDVLQGIDNALKQAKLSPVATASYERNTINIERALDVISAAKPEAVILASVYGPSTQFIKQAHERGFTPIFATMSFVGPEAFAQELGIDSEDIIISQTMPLPNMQPESNCPDGYEYLLAKYFPEKNPTFGTLEGFINAKILAEGIKRAGPSLTRTSLISALESLTDYPIAKELHASFSMTDHQALRNAYLTRIIGGKFVPLDGKKQSQDCIRL